MLKKMLNLENIIILNKMCYLELYFFLNIEYKYMCKRNIEDKQ